MKTSVHVIAPSEVAAKFWRENQNLPYASIAVQSHLEKAESRAHPERNRAARKQIYIAFIGFSVRHKGWVLFKRLHREFVNSKIYKFYHFSDEDKTSDISKVSVRVTCDDKRAMIEALLKSQIDVVLHWTICHETFSFTAHEAYAAGTYIITNESSGNVASMVRQLNCGVVLKDEAELISLMRSRRLADMVTEYRKAVRDRHIKYTLSPMSIPFIINRHTA